MFAFLSKLFTTDSTKCTTVDRKLFKTIVEHLDTLPGYTWVFKSKNAQRLYKQSQPNTITTLKKINELIQKGGRLDVHTCRSTSSFWDIGETPLHIATQDPVLLKMLLAQYKGDINALKEYDGSTLLHEAAKSSQPDSIKLLLKAGARKDVYDKRGRTPLQAFEEASFLKRGGAVYRQKKKNKEIKDIIFRVDEVVATKTIRTIRSLLKEK